MAKPRIAIQTIKNVMIKEAIFISSFIFAHTHHLTVRLSIPLENESPTLPMCFQTVIIIVLIEKTIKIK